MLVMFFIFRNITLMSLQYIYISVYESTWKQMLLGREVCARRVLHKIWPEKLEFLSLLSYKIPINLKQGDHLLKLFFFFRRTKPQVCIIQVWLTIAGTFIRYAVCVCVYVLANLFFSFGGMILSIRLISLLELPWFIAVTCELL